jgi:hypothetical protein
VLLRVSVIAGATGVRIDLATVEQADEPPQLVQLVVIDVVAGRDGEAQARSGCRPPSDASQLLQHRVADLRRQ